MRRYWDKATVSPVSHLKDFQDTQNTETMKQIELQLTAAELLEALNARRQQDALEPVARSTFYRWVNNRVGVRHFYTQEHLDQIYSFGVAIKRTRNASRALLIA